MSQSIFLATSSSAFAGPSRDTAKGSAFQTFFWLENLNLVTHQGIMSEQAYGYVCGTDIHRVAMTSIDRTKGGPQDFPSLG